MLTPLKKGQYALRAVYELAKRQGQGPTKISAIAEAQAIPHRFLEVILHQLKGSGLVASKRGFYGGSVCGLRLAAKLPVRHPLCLFLFVAKGQDRRVSNLRWHHHAESARRPRIGRSVENRSRGLTRLGVKEYGCTIL